MLVQVRARVRDCGLAEVLPGERARCEEGVVARPEGERGGDVPAARVAADEEALLEIDIEGASVLGHLWKTVRFGYRDGGRCVIAYPFESSVAVLDRSREDVLGGESARQEVGVDVSRMEVRIFGGRTNL